MNLIEEKFYNLFWTNKTCREVFSVHKSQLLENEVELILSKEKFYAQRLVLTNSQKRKSGIQIEKRTDNESIELIHNLKKSAKKYFNEEKIEKYVKSKYGKTIKKIEKDIKKVGWIKLASKLLLSIDTEKDFFKLLSDYYLIPVNFENSEQFIEFVENEFKSQFKSFIEKQNLSDLAVSIDLFSTYYNNKIKHNLIYASKHYTDILFDKDNFTDRLSFFDDLFEIEVIKGGKLKSYYECVNCPPNTINGILTTNLKPSNLKIKCPNCNKEMHYIVPYELDLNIYKAIIDNDGILFTAICFLLEKNNYNYLKNQTFLSDVELDICLVNENNNPYEIIEIKMFKTNRPYDTQIGNLRSTVAQLKKIINKLSKEKDLGFKAINYSVVTNITNDEVYKQAKIELEKDLKEYNISIYTIDDFYLKINKSH